MRASSLVLGITTAALAVAAGTGCAGGGRGDEPLFGGAFDDFIAPSPAEAARDAFNIYDPDKRRRSIQLLSAAPFGGEPQYVDLYRLMLGGSRGSSRPEHAPDDDPTVRAAATKALGVHGTSDDSMLVVRMLGDDVAFVRWEAAKALQRIHNPIAIDPLVGSLRTDEDADVRMAATGALGQYPKPVVFDALVGALTNSNYGVVQSARQSLTTLTGQEHGSDSAAWMRWAKQNRGDLFAHQRPYTYQNYVQPPGVLDKIRFWKQAEPARRQAPTGLEPVSRQS